jgi:hypothetical protein
MRTPTIHPLMCSDPECQPFGAKATIEMTPVRVEDDGRTLYRCPKGHPTRRLDPEIAEMAELALAGDDDVRDQLIAIDADLRVAYAAWLTSAAADQDAAIAHAPNDIASLMPDPSVAQSVASDVYDARLHALAGR